MNMEQYPVEAQTAAYSIMPCKWTNSKSQFTEASAQDPLQQLIALNAQHFLSQVQVFLLVCDTCAKQHLKTSTGAIGKKNTSNLKCRLEEDRLWMTKMFTS